jgi:uridine phosphorylase
MYMSEEKINKASAPKADNEGVYRLRLKQGDVPGYVILPGAPERALKIAKNWEDAKEIASYREYKTVVGKYKGMEMAATSTGIGGPSSEICIHELNTLGVHTCIRVGTTGCIVPEFDLGDLIIPVACYRKDGTSAAYIDPEFPAFSNPYVTMALIQACENLGFRYGIGLDYTVGSFYIGQGRPLYEDGRDSYWPSFAEKILPDLTEEELSVFKRGRNAPVKSVPNHASRAQYAEATALEALLGWLYLKGRKDRINELFGKMMEE